MLPSAPLVASSGPLRITHTHAYAYALRISVRILSVIRPTFIHTNCPVNLWVSVEIAGGPSTLVR